MCIATVQWMNFAGNLVVFLVDFYLHFVCVCRKWKEIVDEWVKLKSPGYPGTAVMGNLNLRLRKFVRF